MFTARITRKVGEAITKDEMRGDNLPQLLTDMVMAWSDDEVLEIYIVREVKNASV